MYVITWLVSLLVTYCIALSSHCDIKCYKLSNVPPRWNYNSTVVPIFGFICELKSSCNLDIVDLLRNNTGTGYLKSSTFITVDLYLDCNGSIVGKIITIYFLFKFSLISIFLLYLVKICRYVTRNNIISYMKNGIFF